MWLFFLEDDILLINEMVPLRVTLNNPVRNGRITEKPIEKKSSLLSEDQKAGESVELSRLEGHLALLSSPFSGDYFLKDTLGFSHPFGGIPS